MPQPSACIINCGLEWFALLERDGALWICCLLLSFLDLALHELHFSWKCPVQSDVFADV
jgi:hypothetical protein